MNICQHGQRGRSVCMQILTVQMILFCIWRLYVFCSFTTKTEQNSITSEKNNIFPSYNSTLNKIQKNTSNYCKVHDFHKEVAEIENMPCIKARGYTPQFVICLYKPQEDVYISTSIHRGQIWEPHINRELKRILAEDPTLNMIDIGTNIGSHSLLVAQMGRKVLSVEPVFENIKRLHKSVLLNNFQDRITLVENAISVNRTKLTLNDPKNNKGAYMIVGKTDEGLHINSIRMDDLLEVINFTRAIIKIDVEIHEHKAFAYSTKLFDKIYIPYILMEFAGQPQFFNKVGTVDWLLTTNMLKMLQEKGYVPYISGTQNKLDYKSWDKWPRDIKFKLENKTATNI